MDWLETEPLVDAGRVAVVGHSRGGRLVYSLHEGGHRLGPFEWKEFMDAADKNGWRDER